MQFITTKSRGRGDKDLSFNFEHLFRRVNFMNDVTKQWL